MLRINFKVDSSMRDRIRMSNNTKAAPIMLFPNLAVKQFTLTPSAITHLQNHSLYKQHVDTEMIEQLRRGDRSTHPNPAPKTPSRVSSEVLFKSIVENPRLQEIINKINSVKEDGNMIYVGYTAQNDVNLEAFNLSPPRCSDENGNTDLLLLTDNEENPLPVLIKKKYNATAYVIYSTFSKQAATHLEWFIQQYFHSLIPDHLLNQGISPISYTYTTVDYDKSTQVHRVYVTVLEGVRDAIDEGLVNEEESINYLSKEGNI